MADEPIHMGSFLKDKPKNRLEHDIILLCKNHYKANAAGEDLQVRQIVMALAWLVMYHANKRIAERGMIKTRYTFPIEGTDYCWEVDVFDGPNGPHEWVKVDLEVDNVDFEIPELPIKLEGLIRDNPANRTEEQQKLISELQERYMTVANQYPVNQE